MELVRINQIRPEDVHKSAYESDLQRSKEGTTQLRRQKSESIREAKELYPDLIPRIETIPVCVKPARFERCCLYGDDVICLLRNSGCIAMNSEDELEYVDDSEFESDDTNSPEPSEDDGSEDGQNVLAEDQIEGDFDRLIGDIRGAGDVSNATVLSKLWDVPFPDDANEQFHDDLRVASGIGKVKNHKGKRRQRRQGPALSHQVRTLIGEGNTAYVDGDTKEAIRIMTEVIRIEPRAISAWSVLSTCYRDLNDSMKALQLAIIGAHLRHDADEWYQLAKQSKEHGYHQQALYCYSKAIKLNSNNLDAHWDRASLARDVGDLQAARNSYLSMLRRFPHNSVVLAELRHVLVEQGDLLLCAKMYQDAFDYFTSVNPLETIPSASLDAIDPTIATSRISVHFQAPTGSLTLMDILVLADLYNSLGVFEKAIKTVRSGCRWLQGRGKQSYWDRCQDDREYDLQDYIREEDQEEGEDVNVAKQGFYPLEINARHRLAIARLRSGDINEGQMHAEIVLSQHVTDYSPLFSELADAYFSLNMFDEARHIYELLGADASTSSMHILLQAAACRRNLGDLRDASEIYTHIIATDPTNSDAKMKLAEIYEITGQPRKALDLVYQVIDSRKKRTLAAQDNSTQQLGDDVSGTSLFIEKRRGKAKQTSVRTTVKTLSKEELNELERQKESEAQSWYSRLQLLWINMLNGEEEAENEWLLQAEKLVEMFRETRKLFLAKGALPFRGMIVPLKRTNKSHEIEEDTMASRLELELEHETSVRKGKSKDTSNVSEFRGIHLDSWLVLIIEYAFLVTRKSQFNLAEEILRHVLLSNVYQNQKTQIVIRLALLTCAIRRRNYAVVTEQCRKLMFMHQFNNEPFRLFLVALASGLPQTDEFVDTRLQKFILREMRISEAAVKDNVAWVQNSRRYALPRSTKPTEDNDEDDDDEADSVENTLAKVRQEGTMKPSKDNPVVVAIHGLSCLACKSYQSAIFYLLQAFGHCPNDPVICLSLAVASLGRAMQRQADNRNYMVVQSMGFLTRYRELRQDVGDQHLDEIEYNFGRALHQIGLLSHAVKHYERSLDIVNKKQEIDKNDFGIAREAAYNLSHIYVMTGAPSLAETIVRRWLSI